MTNLIIFASIGFAAVIGINALALWIKKRKKGGKYPCKGCPRLGGGAK